MNTLNICFNISRRLMKWKKKNYIEEAKKKNAIDPKSVPIIPIKLLILQNVTSCFVPGRDFQVEVGLRAVLGKGEATDRSL